MSSLNKVMLLGRVGKDPEIKTINGQGGESKLASFSLATSETWKDKSGEKREQTEWHNIVSFQEGVVKVVEQYVKKGSMLFIEGSMKTRKYQDQSGNDRYTTEVVVGYGGTLKMIGGLNRGNEENRLENETSVKSENSIDDEIPF
jgi:single-strand DNA-binding protein